MEAQGEPIEEGATPREPAPAAPAKSSPATMEQFLLTMTIGFSLAAMLFFASQVYSIGMDIRDALWTQPHMTGDLEAATANGAEVLADARRLAVEDRKQGHSTLPASANGKPLAGLFDDPLTITNFYHRLKDLSPYYVLITRAWVGTYDHLDQEDANVERQLDYPPMRLYTLTLWMWHVHGQYPSLADWPEDPKTYYEDSLHKNVTATQEIMQPMLLVNTTAEIITAVGAFFLVWIWVRRGYRPETTVGNGWRGRWGDPLLLTPVVLLLLCMLSSLFIQWTPTFAGGNLTPPIDDHAASVGFWVMLTLTFLSSVSLAWFLPPPFRGPACGMVAATLVWLNPCLMVDAHLWIQWDSWLPAFFMVAALLVSLDCWLWAGIVLGIACMFKGQILFVAPVFIFSPLLARWPGRFLRIVTGLFLAAGIIVSPWLLDDPSAKYYLMRIIVAGLIGCIFAMCGKILVRRLRQYAPGKPPLRPETPLSPKVPAVWKRDAFWRGFLNAALIADIIVASVIVLCLVLAAWDQQSYFLRLIAVVLCSFIVIVPWILKRRDIAPWLAGIFMAGIWLSGFSLHGKFSWWRIGFAYGTQRHPQMQLGYMSLSNLSSILERRWNWQLHDPVTTLHIPFMDPWKIDLQASTALIYFVTVMICTVGAAIHLRRKDPRFLIALTAPWLLFLTLLTQMAARYTLLPAVIAATLIGVSASLSMFQLLITILGSIMLANQYLTSGHGIAPLTVNFTQPTYPDFGWVMLLASAMLLYLAVAPGRRPTTALEDV